MLVKDSPALNRAHNSVVSTVDKPRRSFTAIFSLQWIPAISPAALTG